MSDDLPHSQKAEQALLGILLYDNLAIEKLPVFFKPEHLHDPVHSRLCSAMLDAINGGGVASPIMLMERFGSDQAFQDMRGFEYLADLVDHAPRSTETSDLCHLITDLALRRDLIRISDEIARGAHKDRETPALQQVDDLERKLFELATFKAEGGPQDLGDVLGGAMEMAAQAYMRDGGMAGLSTGLQDLDRKLGGLRPGNLIILAARPSMGKTALATNIGIYNAKSYATEEQPDGSLKRKQGGVTAFFSLEQSSDELGVRILADEAGIASDRITTGRIDASEFGRLRDAALEIKEAPIFIDDSGALSLSAIATRCRRLKRTVGLDLAIIDYLQLVTIGGDKNLSRQEVVSAVAQGLKALAKELSIPVIALSQLTRQVENRPDKKPQLSDLKESGAIEQDADVVMFVYRHSYYLEREAPKEGSVEHLKWEEELDRCRNEADIIIGKQRHGSVGTVKVAFKGETTKFSDTPRDEDRGA